jgi:hypothetical protein
MNTKPRPAPPGGALQHEHMPNPDDAIMLIFNDAQQPGTAGSGWGWGRGEQ